MKPWKKIALILTAVSFVFAGTAAFALRGPLQALFPARHGLHEIADNIWSDDPALDRHNLSMLAKARDDIAGLYGAVKATPRVILCSKQPCANLFFANGGRTGPRGKTYGARLVVLGPRGLNQIIITHELAHAELHRLMRISEMLHPRFPAWFDEGMSSWISQDNRLTRPDSSTRARILKTRSFRDFNAIVSRIGWKAAYGAAMDEVAHMATIGGNDGLLAFIESVGDGADFGQERAKLLGLHAAGIGNGRHQAQGAHVP